MQRFPATLLDVFVSAWQHRALILSLVRRDVLGRYRGSVMGVLWSFLNPLFMLAVYTFVFSVVFGARWGVGTQSKVDFALILFAGLIVFNLFAECVTRAPTIVLVNPNYVKKMVFPLEVLPWVLLGSALFHAAVSLGVWLLGYVCLKGAPSLTALALPAVLVPLFLMVLGLTWLLASLGVYVRDISQVVGILTTTLLFLTPIFYPAEALPVHYRAWLSANPLAAIVEQTRGVLYWGRLPDPVALTMVLSVSVGIAWLGFAWFQKTRRGFADVL